MDSPICPSVLKHRRLTVDDLIQPDKGETVVPGMLEILDDLLAIGLKVTLLSS